MSKRDLLTLLDLNTREIKALLHKALNLKERWRKGKHDFLLQGKTLGMVLYKPSVRTRVSFETAMSQLGGSTLLLTAKEIEPSPGERNSDIVKVLSRYLQGLVICGHEQGAMLEMANYASIPVINGFSSLYDPCQVLSDLFTILEKKKEIEGIRIAWVGGGNNVAHSWINAAMRLEFTLVMACPEEYPPREDILKKAREVAGDRIVITRDPMEAVANADVINADVWMDTGQEAESEAVLEAFKGFQVNGELAAKARPNVIVLHRLPAHRDYEISSEMMEDPRSVILDQAENKMHLHKALLSFLIGGELDK
jgi:ornithine carbamoyltransferase